MVAEYGYGEEGYGGELQSAHALFGSSQLVHLTAHKDEHPSLPAYITGAVFGEVLGTQRVFMYGASFFYEHTNLPTWGPAVDIPNGVINVYNPKRAYISMVVLTMSAPVKRAYITSTSMVLRSPTLDALNDPYTIRVDDISINDNDGQTVNNPIWVDGPHPI